jgi:hypothetical protein
VRLLNGLLNPTRELLIALIALFLVVALVYAFTGILGPVLLAVLVILLIYFIVLAVREFQRAPERREE